MDKVLEVANIADLDPFSKAFTEHLDKEDNLASFRDEFHIPLARDISNRYKDANCPSQQDDDDDGLEAKQALYFGGNSLGLLPKKAEECVQRLFSAWAKYGVVEHETWIYGDTYLRKQMQILVGAQDGEVVLMNSLTVNLSLALIGFYRPTATRYKILLEAQSFPSDFYLVQSHVKFHGYDPNKAIAVMEPRHGEEILRTEDILKRIEQEGEEIALVLFPGVQYYTGQLFEMTKITEVGHKMGCKVGFDLAHAVGNVMLQLNAWDVDFACWCTYKYLNSGPGSIGGFFLHNKYQYQFDIPRLIGWWSHKVDTRFQIDNNMDMQEGAAGFQLSNPPMIVLACLEASLYLFSKAGMENIINKSILLTGYMELLLRQDDILKKRIRIITPADVKQRGAQLSLYFNFPAQTMCHKMKLKGIVSDFRAPNVVRLAPIPLYNSFRDVYEFYLILRNLVESHIENS